VEYDRLVARHGRFFLSWRRHAGRALRFRWTCVSSETIPTWPVTARHHGEELKVASAAAHPRCRQQEIREHRRSDDPADHEVICALRWQTASGDLPGIAANGARGLRSPSIAWSPATGASACRRPRIIRRGVPLQHRSGGLAPARSGGQQRIALRAITVSPPTALR
jgi:hypothetical protein